MDEVWKTIAALAAAFEERDAARGVSVEEQWTLQVLKIGEEFGEAAQAVIGARGTNPRKGDSHTWQDVHDEVADTIITAMVALTRMRPDDAPAHLAAQLALKSGRFLPRAADGPDPGRTDGPRA
ncbi:MazG-like family protein [Streptomyces sp. NPDC012888]|uniref:MazG-like family protein n=1 Tax=Streptomyces sp. NPDC012888 TaxID=3364855 RepID=UPI003694A7D7